MEFVRLLLALSPILWLLVALSGIKMAGWKACPIALAIALALALTVWRMPAENALTAALEGVALALWPIVLVIIAAVFTYNLSLHTGSMEVIKRMLTGVTTDRRVLVLIIAWGFGGFLEGMAGFGTAVAIPASMLFALGFEPLFAASVCLIADATPTAFGSIGIPVVTLGQVTGLDPVGLASATALQLFPMVVLTPFLLIAMTGGGLKALRRLAPLALLSGLSFALPELLVARWVGAELPVVVGSVCSMLCTIAGARLLEKRKAAPADGTADAPRSAEPVSLRRGLTAWLPFLLIFLFLIVTSKLILPLHRALDAVRTSVPIYTGGGASPYTFVWVNTPGVLILLAAFLGGAAQGAHFPEMLGVLGSTVRGLAKTIVTIVAVMATAKVMGYSGMIGVIAAAAVAATGTYYPLIAPVVGSLGTFITGSATSSSVLFGKLQAEAAGTIGSGSYWTAAANTLGACAGKIISPQSIAIAVASTGLSGSEGKIFNSTIRYFIVFIVLMGLIAYFGVPLFAGLFGQ